NPAPCSWVRSAITGQTCQRRLGASGRSVARSPVRRRNRPARRTPRRTRPRSTYTRRPSEIGWSGSRGIRQRTEDVPRAASGMNQRRVTWNVDLFPEAIDVDLDRIRGGIVVVVPDVSDDVASADHSPGPAAEKLEEGIFLGGEIDVVRSAPSALSAG